MNRYFRIVYIKHNSNQYLKKRYFEIFYNTEKQFDFGDVGHYKKIVFKLITNWLYFIVQGPENTCHKKKMNREKQLDQITQENGLKQNSEVTVPVLTYYNIRGICQPIRNLLYFIQVDFKDRRIEKSNQDTKQYQGFEGVFNAGLPIFEDEYIKISDSIAISFYICRKYERKELLGKDIRSSSKINEVLFKYYLEKSKTMPFIMEIILSSSKHAEEKKENFVILMLGKLLKSSRFLTYCLKQHSKTKSWIQQQITIVDFYFYQICYYLKGFFQDYIHRNQELKGFLSFAQLIENMSWYKKCKMFKPKIFLPFKNQKNSGSCGQGLEELSGRINCMNQQTRDFIIILQFYNFYCFQSKQQTDSIIKKMEENKKVVELKNISGNDLVQQMRVIVQDREVEEITFFITFRPKQSKSKGKGQKNLQEKTYEALNVAKQKKACDQMLQKFKMSFKAESKQPELVKQIISLYERGEYEKIIQMSISKEIILFAKYNQLESTTSQDHKQKINDQYNSITFYLGNCFYRLKKYDNAIEYYKKSLEGEAIKQKAQRLNNLGTCYAVRKSYQLALKVYNESIKLYGECSDDDVSSLLNNIAMIYMKCDMLKSAEDFFIESIKQKKIKSPNNKQTLFNSYYNLGVCQKNLRKLDESLNSLMIALNYAYQGNGNKIDVINQICLVYELQQKWSEALTHYEKLSQEYELKNKHQGPIYERVSKIHDKLGNTILAAKFAKRAYKLYYADGDQRKMSQISGSIALNSPHYT